MLKEHTVKLLTFFFLILVGCILTHPKLSLYYAGMGLELWFRNMLPSLLPFMILSGIMVQMKITEKFAMILYPIVKPLYQVRKNVCYAMLMGFLCGFPMGARVVNDLYTRRMLTRREAEYLLAFCNNIGPVYFCTFALPLLERRLMLPYLFGMYGIPLLYGLALRHTLYRDLSQSIKNTVPSASAGLICCEYIEDTEAAAPKHPLTESFLAETDRSIQSSIQAMLALGGYMMLYNLLNLIPHILLGHPLRLLSPLLEITGGLKMLGTAHPLYSLLALSFGGLCCIAQTYNCIGNSDLSIGNYILHKGLLTILNAAFYLSWFLLASSSFLC
jgi:sporulation integral membrane protein YlbJ